MNRRIRNRMYGGAEAESGRLDLAIRLQGISPPNPIYTRKSYLFYTRLIHVGITENFLNVNITSQFLSKIDPMLIRDWDLLRAKQHHKSVAEIEYSLSSETRV